VRNASADGGIFTLTPRVGYRIPLSKHVDLTPRLGGTIATTSATGTPTQTALGVGVDAAFAVRVTDRFHILLCPEFVVAAASSGDSGSPKETLVSFQAWLGVGGYL